MLHSLFNRNVEIIKFLGVLIMKLTKQMTFQILKPVDIDWKEFGEILNKIRYRVPRLMNFSLQKIVEWENIKKQHYFKTNEWLKDKDYFGKTLTGYINSLIVNDEFFNIIATNIIDESLQKANKLFKARKKEINNYEISLPSFKTKNSPIYLKGRNIILEKQDKFYIIKLPLMSRKSGQKTSYQASLLVKSKSQKTIINRLLNEEYKLGCSQIIYNERKRKWFVKLTYSFEQKQEFNLDKDKILGVDIGIVKPISIALNDSLKWFYIDSQELNDTRKKIEKYRNSVCKSKAYCSNGNIGHGRNSRMKNVYKIKDKVARYKDTINHKYSKYVVDKAVAFGCGVIQMEKLTGITNVNTFLRNWPYFDLQQKIEYKAKEKGIEVKYIDPHFTSQRCNVCGYIHEDNRKTQAEFVCQNCGYGSLYKCTSCGYRQKESGECKECGNKTYLEKVNADFNAAKNIAIDGIEKIIKEQCKKQGIKRNKNTG